LSLEISYKKTKKTWLLVTLSKFEVLNHQIQSIGSHFIQASQESDDVKLQT